MVARGARPATVEEDQARDTVREQERGVGRHKGAHRVADEHSLLHAVKIKDAHDVPSVLLQAVPACGLIGVAPAAQIHAQQASGVLHVTGNGAKGAVMRRDAVERDQRMRTAPRPSHGQLHGPWDRAHGPQSWH